jgi:magnesium transporter
MVRSVSPIYYVTFTTAVLTASLVLFQGFNMTDSIGTLSLLYGFLIIFSGVYLLNYRGNDADRHKSSDESLANGAVADGAGDVRTRLALQDSPRSSEETQREDRTGLMQFYDVRTDGYMLQDLSRDSEERVDEGG